MQNKEAGEEEGKVGEEEKEEREEIQSTLEVIPQNELKSGSYTNTEVALPQSETAHIHD